MNWIFGEKATAPPPNPKEQVRGWVRDVRRQQRGIERDVASLLREELKLKEQMKKLKNGPRQAVVPLARALVRMRATRMRMDTSKQRLESVAITLDMTASELRVVHQLSSSTQLMQQMQQLVSMPELRASSIALAKEMHKAGLLSESLEDAFALVDQGVEEAADAEVDKVLLEITGKELAQFASVDGLQAVAVDGKSDTVAVASSTSSSSVSSSSSSSIVSSGA